MKYKDHPALLAWMVGNEANLFFENPRVFDAINDIAGMIHEVDGLHPVTTALAGFNPELAGLIEQRAPDLDFVSIQMYGDIVHLPAILEASDWEAPLFVTEWGAIGHWEVAQTSWGAPIEGRIDDPGLDRIRVTAPADPGAYRLFVYIYDGRGKAGHANIPFYVE